MPFSTKSKGAMRPLPFAVVGAVLLAIWLGALWYVIPGVPRVAIATAPAIPTSPAPRSNPGAPPPQAQTADLPAPGAATSDLATPAEEFRQLLQSVDFAAIDRWLQQLAHKDPLRALELVETLEREPRNRARSIILAAWMQNAPRPALAWAHANFPDFFNWPDYAIACAAIRDISLVEEGVLQRKDANPIGNQFALRRITLEWGKIDPAYMMTWVQSLDPTTVPVEVRNYAMAGVLEARARTEPDEVIRWIQQATPNDHNSRRIFYGALAQGWKDTGQLEAAEKFFGANLANLEYNLAMNVILPAIAEQSPVRAEDWLRALPTTFLYTAMINTSSAVEEKDPGLAARWWLTYNPDINREPAIRNLERKLAALPSSERDSIARLIEATPQLAPENRARLFRALATAR